MTKNQYIVQEKRTAKEWMLTPESEETEQIKQGKKAQEFHQDIYQNQNAGEPLPLPRGLLMPLL